MNQVILVAHGHLATEMKKSAEMLFGSLTNFHPIDFLEGEGLESLSDKIYNKMKTLNSPTLIFVDLFGGTPFNASCSVCLKHPEKEMEIISGMSLPLVLEIATQINNYPIKTVKNNILHLSNEIVKDFDKAVMQEEEEL